MIRYSQNTQKRLVWIDQKADEEFWDAQWVRESDIEVKALHAEEMVNTTARYLSPDQSKKIIEGGCGNGGVVLALQRAGYSVLGVDYAVSTVERLNKDHPELDIVTGDVRDLSDIQSEAYDGYWSLGVIEHFWDGYTPILSEIHRVLKPGGYLFLTFPWYSPIRRLKSLLGIISPLEKQAGNDNPEPNGFYQFSLNPCAVKADLEALGFEIVERRARSGLHGLGLEWSWTNALRRFIAAALGKKSGDGSGSIKSQVSAAPKNASNMSLKQRVGLFLDRVIAPIFGHSYLIVVRRKQG